MTNLEEYNYFKQTGRDISPKLKDTDDDGYDDGYETKNNYDPTNPFSHPVGKTIPLILIILGLLSIIGAGSYLGYVAYQQRARVIPPGAIPPSMPPSMPPPTMRPTVHHSQLAAIKRRKDLMKDIEKRRKQTIFKRKRAKTEKREKFFERFGHIKKPKRIFKQGPPLKAPPVEELPPRDEFEKLARLTRRHKEKPLKVKKPQIKDEFDKLTKLVESKPIKRGKQVPTHNAKDLFNRLEKLKEKTEKLKSKKK